MKKFASMTAALAAFFVFASVASAQFTADESSVVGVWDVDVVAMMVAEGAPPEALAMAESMSMAISMNADYTMSMDAVIMGETESEAGSWAFVSAEGAVATVTATNPAGETTEVVWTFTDADNVSVTAEGETLTLVRHVAVAE